MPLDGEKGGGEKTRGKQKGWEGGKQKSGGRGLKSEFTHLCEVRFNGAIARQNNSRGEREKL